MAAQNNNTRLLEDIVSVPVIQGDDALIQEILEASESEDDLSLVFEWSLEGLTQFVQKIQQLPANAPAPPEEMVAAVQAVTTAPTGKLPANIVANCIVQHIRKLVPGIRILGSRACLACTLIQFTHAALHLNRLDFDRWFHYVLQSGSPLNTPLAALYVPRPRSNDGLCDVVHVPGGILWA